MKPNPILTGQQCRAARRDDLGVSQQQLAKDAGVSRTYITNFENGVYEPTDKVKAKLRTYFESKGVEFGDPEVVSDGGASAALPRSLPKRSTLFRGPECFYLSAKLADDQQRERIVERIFAIRDRLVEIGKEKAGQGFLDPYDGKTEELISEARSLISEAGLLYERIFGNEIAVVPTKELLDRKARPETLADALGLVFMDVFSNLGIRRNTKRIAAPGDQKALGDQGNETEATA